jgi:predicted ABC-type ATPase
MNQTVDNIVSQTAYSEKSGGFFSWGAFMFLLCSLNLFMFYTDPLAPYSGKTTLKSHEKIQTVENITVINREELSSIDRAMHTLEDMQARREAMKKFSKTQGLDLSARDLTELEITMKQAGFSEFYISDFINKKKFEMSAEKMAEDDTAEFAKSIAKDIVKEEVSSFAHRLELIAKVGNFVARKVQSSSGQ